MSTKIGGTDEFNSEINVTPMVDVMLVLLIIFMIVTPLLQQGVSVNLPRDMISPDPDEEIAKDTSVIIAIPDNNNFYIGKEQYPIDALGDVIKRRMEGKTPKSASFTSRVVSMSIMAGLCRQSTRSVNRISIRSGSSPTGKKAERLRPSKGRFEYRVEVYLGR